MADVYWTGSAGDNDWSTANNWLDSTGSTGAPVSSDNVIFPEGNSISVTSGMDQGSVDLGTLYVHPLYNGNIGSETTPLIIEANRIIHMGSGELHVESSNDGANNLLIDEVVILAANPSTRVTLGSESGDEGAITTIRVLRGNVKIASSITAAITLVECSPFTGVDTDCTMHVEESGPTLTELQVHGGTANVNVAVTTAYQTAGLWRHDKAAVTDAFLSGGTCEYNRRAVSGDSTKFELVGNATLDLMQTADIKTITDVIRKSRRARVLRNTDIHTITTYQDYGSAA